MDFEDIEELIKLDNEKVDLELKIKMLDKLEEKKLAELEKSDLAQEEKEKVARKYKVDYIIQLFNGRDISINDKVGIVKNLDSSDIFRVIKEGRNHDLSINGFEEIASRMTISERIELSKHIDKIERIHLFQGKEKELQDALNFNRFENATSCKKFLDEHFGSEYFGDIKKQLDEITKAIREKDKTYAKNFLSQGKLNLLTYEETGNLLGLLDFKELIEIRERNKSNSFIVEKIRNVITYRIRALNLAELVALEELVVNEKSVKIVSDYFTPKQIFEIIIEKWDSELAKKIVSDNLYDSGASACQEHHNE
jgi:hypothetical protein